MKKLLLLSMLMAFTFGISAQTTLIEDDFESYTTGGFVADQSGVWTTWSNNPGSAEDAIISEDYAVSGAKSMLVGGTNDMILPLGDKTSGVYDVNFEFLVETGFGGYYNIQHFEAPGNQWALECYFGEDGTGRLHVEGSDFSFTYPKDTWFTIENHIDISADEATVTINGTEVHTWQFSLQADGSAGENQLGGVNLYAGAEEGETSKYFVDDIIYIEIEQGVNPPTIETSIVGIGTNGTASETFDVTNTGEQELNFVAYDVYPEATKKSSTPAKITKRVRLNPKTLNRPEVTSEVAENPITIDLTRDGTLTHVQSNLGGGVGYGSPVTVRAAALFKPEHVADFIGMYVANVIIFHNDLPEAGSTTMRIYDRGEFITPGPGEIVAEQAYTPDGAGSQTPVLVNDPVYVSGKDLWIGYECNDLGEENFPLGCDEGPVVPGVNWTSTGPGWSEWSQDSNLGIIAELAGDGIETWLSVSPASGTITPGNNVEMTASFDLSNLAGGTYHAEINIGSNDPSQQYTTLPVTLSVASGTGIDNADKIGVMTFPNPANNVLNISSNENIQTVKVMNTLGQVVKNIEIGNSTYSMNISDLEKGIYIVEIKAANNQISTRKIVVE
ncbi:MAG: T9SS type A sorting domain-containing protein [Bacteroidota bacterium]|nr:T9SS type A sorting domain-containing protein [Bacteroidota bacterium]